MILVEKIETLNERLTEFFGKLGDEPIWQIVWSEDQREKVRGTFYHYDNSNNLLSTEKGIGEVPKYSYIKEKFILERLTLIPEVQKEELLGKQLSYEPAFVFEDKDGNYLPPKWEVIEVVINAIHEKAAKIVGANYKAPNSDEELEAKEKRVKRIQEELFGNETDVTDKLAAREAIIVPGRIRRRE